MQPLGTKKIMQALRTKKNHATYEDKKIKQPFETKKNHPTSWDKKSSAGA